MVVKSHDAIGPGLGFDGAASEGSRCRNRQLEPFFLQTLVPVTDPPPRFSGVADIGGWIRCFARFVISGKRVSQANEKYGISDQRLHSNQQIKRSL